MIATFGKKFQPLNYKLETTGFHYFDEKQLFSANDDSDRYFFDGFWLLG